MLKRALSLPSVYQFYQEAGGFFGARAKAMSEYLAVRPGMRIIDIGCGPGYTVKLLPSGVDYIGFDIEESYISHANRVFGRRGRFFCRFFDADAARTFGLVDIVMMNGVLHHIADNELSATLQNVRNVLRPGGLLFTLDGCYRKGQTAFRRWMLDNDRGRFVRDEDGYRQVLMRVFDKVELWIREDYSRVPYTFVVGLAAR